MSTDAFIGIDFGTSYSTACWWNSRINAPEVIRNEHGDEKTPSAVFIGPKNETLIGKPALDQLADAAHLPVKDRDEVFARTFVGIKRLLKDNLVLALPDGETITPVELATHILRHIKKSAEDRCFHEKINSAVLTHPVLFTAREKDRLREAAEWAGFARIILVEEPVAAVMGYVASGAKAGKGILVYDLGGGTLDLAYVERTDEDKFHIPVEPSGAVIGGDDFDRLLYDHFNHLLEKEHGFGFDSVPGGINLHVLMECRRLKEKLSSLPKARLTVAYPEKNLQIKYDLTRVEHEALILDQVKNTVELTKALQERVQHEKRTLDTVVLVGGPTRTPLIRNELKKILSIEPLETMHADVAVAMGAAFVANDWQVAPERYRMFEAPAPTLSWEQAMEAADLRQIQLHWLSGRDVDEVDNEGLTALGCASRRGCTQVVLLCLMNGSDLTLDSNYNSLYMAASNGHDNVVRILLDAAVNVNVSGYDSTGSPLHVAAFYGHEKVVKLLLDAGANINALDYLQYVEYCDVEHAEYYGDKLKSSEATPLHRAIIAGYDKIVQMLVESGADINAEDDLGMTPLFYAMRPNSKYSYNHNIFGGEKEDGTEVEIPERLAGGVVYKRIIEYLVSKGASIGNKEIIRDNIIWIVEHGHDNILRSLIPHIDINNIDNDDIYIHYNPASLLHIVAKTGNPKIVRILLEAGANIDARADENQTPLHFAALLGVDMFLWDAINDTAHGKNVDWGPDDGSYEHIVDYIVSNKNAITEHEEVALLLLKAGAIIEARDHGASTPLHLAAVTNHKTMVEVLLNNGADVNAMDCRGLTPLHHAASSGREQNVEVLLKAGAMVDATTRYEGFDGHDNGHQIPEATPLQIAAKMGFDDMDNYIMNINQEYIMDTEDHDNRTSLLLASSRRYYDIVGMLLNAGAEINVHDHDLKTPLHYAIWVPEIVERMINMGAQVDALDCDQRTPLHEAASANANLSLQALLDAGADINARDHGQRTPLHMAASANADLCIHNIIDLCGDINVRDHKQRTPLHAAASANANLSLQALLDAGANINARDHGQRTPLHLAVEEREYNLDRKNIEEVLHMLIETGAEVDARDNKQRTPLHVASAAHYYVGVQTLIDVGADVNAYDDEKQTPLHRAIERRINDFGYTADRDRESVVKVVQMLLEAGAQINAQDNKQRTPLHLAAEKYDYKQIIKILLQAGADISAKDSEGKTPAQVADYSVRDLLV